MRILTTTNKMDKRAQGITEYALVVAIAVVALLAMHPYFKRGVQSVVKVSVDQLAGFRGDPSDPGSEVTPEQAQKMAINQELDPKYGALKSYEIIVSANHSVTATTPPGGEGAKNTVINKWEDTVKDVDPNKGKEFYQELRY